MRTTTLLFAALLLLAAGCAQQAAQPQAPAQPAQNAAAPSAPPAAPPATAPAAPNATAPAMNETTAPAPAPPPLPQIPSTDFTYSSGGWVIHGTAYPSSGNAPTTAVILLHDIGQNRSSFPYYFIKDVHDGMPNVVVIAIDMEGNGESTNIGTWQSFDTDAFKTMKTNIIDLGTKYIGPRYPSVKQYFVVGAGMGATTALLAATQEHKIIKIAMLSPQYLDHGVGMQDAIPDYTQEMFLVASSQDTYSVQSIGQISGVADKLQVTQQVYDGSAKGTDIFDETQNTNQKLSADLISFFRMP